MVYVPPGSLRQKKLVCLGNVLDLRKIYAKQLGEKQVRVGLATTSSASKQPLQREPHLLHQVFYYHR